jgi:hypothetical protein
VCPCKLELERDVGPVRAYELGCASEQRGSGPVVLAVDRAVAGGREPGGGAVGEAGVGLPELCVIPAKVRGWGPSGSSHSSAQSVVPSVVEYSGAPLQPP